MDAPPYVTPPPDSLLPLLPPKRATLVGYLALFGVSWALAAVVLLWRGNADLFLALNTAGTSGTDLFFRWITHLGDGVFFVIVSVAYLLMGLRKGRTYANLRQGLALLAGFALSSFFAQGLKRAFFSDWVRPKTFFEARHISIHLSEGVTVYGYHSFPSGHAMSAFCLATLLAYIIGRPSLQVGFLILAWLVALSRVMLAQHFPLDVLVGAALGVACALLARILFLSEKPRSARSYLQAIRGRQGGMGAEE